MPQHRQLVLTRSKAPAVEKENHRLKSAGWEGILLMIEILHHLGYIKPYKLVQDFFHHSMLVPRRIYKTHSVNDLDNQAADRLDRIRFRTFVDLEAVVQQLKIVKGRQQ